MFIISLTYQVPLNEVDKFIPEHIEYLNAQYEQGHFVLSGRKKPRAGGVIISTSESPRVHRKTLERELAHDPFYRENI